MYRLRWYRRRSSARGCQTMVRWQKQIFIHTWLSRDYLALARLSCHVVCLLSRYRLSNCISKMTHACFFWTSWMALKTAGFNAEDAQSGVPCPLHTLRVALVIVVNCVADDVLRQTWPGVDETLISADWRLQQESCKHAPASNLRFCSWLGSDQDCSRWPQICRDELRCLLLQELSSLTCLVCRCTVLLEQQTRRLQCDAWLAASVASAGLDGNIGRPLSRQVQQRTAPNSPALRRQLKTISIVEKVDAFASYSIKNSRHFAIFRCLVWKTKRWLKKQIYAKTRKPYSRVFSIFLPNVIKINPYYFKVGAFSDTMYSLM